MTEKQFEHSRFVEDLRLIAGVADSQLRPRDFSSKLKSYMLVMATVENFAQACLVHGSFDRQLSDKAQKAILAIKAEVRPFYLLRFNG